MRSVLIIGGGAAGMTAAVLLAEGGCDVTILERQDRIGKKILQTGNGRCNISNTMIRSANYVTGDEEKLKHILAAWDVQKERNFLSGLGISLCERDGCLYPVSRQASSVLDAYRFRLREKKVRMITDVYAVKLKKKENGYAVIGRSADGEVGYGDFSKVILSCGGKAGVYREEEKNGFEITRALGHTLTTIHPALVPLKCEGDFKAVAGVRADAVCRLRIEGKEIMREKGEVQFTDSGLSGIPIFQLSIRVEKPECRKTEIEMDLLSFLGGEKEAFSAFTERVNHMKGRNAEEFFAGWLQKKLAQYLIKKAEMRPSAMMSELNEAQSKRLYDTARHLMVRVKAGGAWKNAQIQSGGIPLSEVTEELESVKSPGVYLAGEMLDAAGMCGGYNLHFALASASVCASAILSGEKR